MIGSILVLGACTWTHFLKEADEVNHISLFCFASILGLGTAITLVMCLSMLSEMVGENTVRLQFNAGVVNHQLF